jgi:thymidine phosphorylase
MEQPNGRAVGNSLEVAEALATLSGDGPRDLVELVSGLGAELLFGVGVHPDRKVAADALLARLASGASRETFERMVAAQGGMLAAGLPVAVTRRDYKAPRSGWLVALDGAKIGYALIALGGGRRTMTDAIDPAVGFEFHVRLGDPVEAGRPLLTIHENGRGTAECEALLGEAFSIADEPRPAPPMFLERIGA